MNTKHDLREMIEDSFCSKVYKDKRTAAERSTSQRWNNTAVSGGNDEECFVATAVYGDISAPQVQALREYRDNVLVHNLLGKAFIDFYYSGAGKKAANFIKNHLPSSIPLLRKGLDFLVEHYSERNR